LLAMPAAHERAAPTRAARAKVLVAAGQLAMRQDDQDTGELLYREALEISRQLGDRRGQGIALYSLGHVCRQRGNYRAARELHAEAMAIFESMGEKLWLAHAHHDLGEAAGYEDDLATA